MLSVKIVLFCILIPVWERGNVFLIPLLGNRIIRLIVLSMNLQELLIDVLIVQKGIIVMILGTVWLFLVLLMDAINIIRKGVM